MGNLCSIFHAHFDKLVALTNSHNKAVFLDKCIFWWQISKYTLGDEKIWFTRKLSEIAKELSVSERSISRYLEEFEEKGLLERVCKLSASNKNDSFKVTKSLYIRVTDKLLALLQLPKQPNNTLSLKKDCSFSTQHGDIDKDNLAVSIYKDKDDNTINNTTVRQTGNVNNLKINPIKTQPEPNQQSYAIEKIIGEQLEPRLKNYIKGMLKNIQTQHAIQISNPEQLFAEVVFSVLNKENQLIGIEDSHHRVNIIAKLLRARLWETPKGFYNHWDVGQLFQQKRKTKERIYQQQKIADMNLEVGEYAISNEEQVLPFSSQKHASNPYSQDLELKQVKSQLQALHLEINSENQYLMQMKVSYQKTKNNLTQTVINGIALKLKTLYEQQAVLNQKLDKSRAA